MFSKYAFFNIAALFVLSGLSIVGAAISLLSWTAIKPEYEEGVQTSGGKRMASARVCLTVGCVVVWLCTLFGFFLNGPRSPSLPFGFWQDFPAALQFLFLPIDGVLFASVAFASWARGRGRLVFIFATGLMAVATLAGSIILWSP